MLKDLLSNRLFIGALAFFVLCVGGSLLYSYHEKQKGEAKLAETQDRLKQFNERQQPQLPAEAPVGDTSQGGHFHADVTWSDRQHEAPQVPSQVQRDIGKLDAPAGIDWDRISPEERRKRFRDAYYAKWGDEPSWNGEYRHVYDSKGVVRRHYRNKPLVTHYEIRQMFAPSPAQLEQYLALKAGYQQAKEAGDTYRANAIAADMQNMVDNALGQVPSFPYSYIYYGTPMSIEEQKPLRNEAVRELYKFYGVEHLYEFYEKADTN